MSSDYPFVYYSHFNRFTPIRIYFYHKIELLNGGMLTFTIYWATNDFIIIIDIFKFDVTFFQFSITTPTQCILRSAPIKKSQ